MEIRPFQTSDEDAVIALWRTCGLLHPTNDPRKDIHRKLRADPDLFLVGVLNSSLVATAMFGYEGHRGWVNYLAVAPENRRSGFGSRLMAEGERLLRARGCPKINLQIRASNTEAIPFYQSLGFAQDEVLSMGKRLEFDSEPSHG